MFLFGFKRTVFMLRKRYDRVREKADKQGDSQKRMAVLRILDKVEPTLVMLEEQKVSRFDRGRFVNVVKNGIDEAKRVLEKGLPILTREEPQQQYQERR